MSDIFLSYKQEEKAIAKIFAGALKLKGFSVATPQGELENSWNNTILYSGTIKFFSKLLME